MFFRVLCRMLREIAIPFAISFSAALVSIGLGVLGNNLWGIDMMLSISFFMGLYIFGVMFWLLFKSSKELIRLEDEKLLHQINYSNQRKDNEL